MSNNLNSSSFKDKLQVMRSLYLLQENVNSVKNDSNSSVLHNEENASNVETLSFINYHNSVQPIKLKKR